MSTTVLSQEQLENEWAIWLSSLAPWELHYVLSGDRELDWHDDFITGIADFDAFRAEINAHFEEVAKGWREAEEA